MALVSDRGSEITEPKGAIAASFARAIARAVARLATVELAALWADLATPSWAETGLSLPCFWVAWLDPLPFLAVVTSATWLSSCWREEADTLRTCFSVGNELPLAPTPAVEDVAAAKVTTSEPEPDETNPVVVLIETMLPVSIVAAGTVTTIGGVVLSTVDNIIPEDVSNSVVEVGVSTGVGIGGIGGVYA